MFSGGNRVFGVVSRRFGVIFGRFGMVWGVLGCFHGPVYTLNRQDQCRPVQSSPVKA